jgi:phosphate transport system substrate-binding protein
MRFARNTLGVRFVALSALLLGAVSFGSAGAAMPAKPLVLAGSSTVSPLMSDIARRFEAANQGVAVQIVTVGSGPGVAELRAERCDIAMISRPVSARERDLFAFPIARDGAAIVVNRSNPVRNITAAQLRDVLTGRITNWAALGGRAAPILVVWRPPNQGVPDLLTQLLKLKPEQIHSQAEFFDNADAVNYVAKNRNAIGFASLGVAESLAKSGVPVKLLAYEGVAASNLTLRDHTYALARPLILLARSVPTGVQKQLIDYATSSAVTDLHEQHGFVPYGQ